MYLCRAEFTSLCEEEGQTTINYHSLYRQVHSKTNRAKCMKFTSLEMWANKSLAIRGLGGNILSFDYAHAFCLYSADASKLHRPKTPKMLFYIKQDSSCHILPQRSSLLRKAQGACKLKPLPPYYKEAVTCSTR